MSYFHSRDRLRSFGLARKDAHEIKISDHSLTRHCCPALTPHRSSKTSTPRACPVAQADSKCSTTTGGRTPAAGKLGATSTTPPARASTRPILKVRAQRRMGCAGGLVLDFFWPLTTLPVKSWNRPRGDSSGVNRKIGDSSVTPELKIVLLRVNVESNG